MMALRATAMALCGTLSIGAHAGSYQDLWWNPDESGWGVNIIQQANILVATWFIYDTDGKPLWLLGTAASSGGTSYAGEVYKYTGPPYAAASFDANAVTETAVGTTQLNFADLASGTISYTVNGATVTKNIIRQSYAYPKIADTYVVSAIRVRSGCSDSSQNGTVYLYNHAYDFYAVGNTLSISYGNVDADGVFMGACSAVGTMGIHGSVVSFSAPFNCVNGTAGTLAISDLRVTDSGFLGSFIWQYAAGSSSCRFADSTSGARKQAVPLTLAGRQPPGVMNRRHGANPNVVAASARSLGSAGQARVHRCPVSEAGRHHRATRRAAVLARLSDRPAPRIPYTCAPWRTSSAG